MIADNHLELLGSLDAIADAKGELLEALPEAGVAVLNADDPYLPYLAGKDRGAGGDLFAEPTRRKRLPSRNGRGRRSAGGGGFFR